MRQLQKINDTSRREICGINDTIINHQFQHIHRINLQQAQLLACLTHY